MLLWLLIACIVLFVVLPFAGATLIGLVWALVVGLVLGAIARLIVPGRSSMGLLMTAVVGVLGALIGTVLARALETGSFGRLLLQIGAAVLLVMVLRPERAT